MDAITRDPGKLKIDKVENIMGIMRKLSESGDNGINDKLVNTKRTSILIYMHLILNTYSLLGRDRDKTTHDYKRENEPKRIV